MPEKILMLPLSLASRPEGSEDLSVARHRRRRAAPEERVTIEAGHPSFLAVLARSVKTANNYTRSHGRDRALDAVVVALAAGATAAGVARPGRGRRRPGAARAASAARLRGRGTGTPPLPRRGGRGACVPASGRRLRRVVPQRLGGRYPRAAQGAPPDVRRADVWGDAAGRQGRQDRGAVHEAALVADRD